MAKLNNSDVKRLINEVFAINLMNSNREEGYITLLIEGTQGIGKSVGVKEAAKQIGGYVSTIEGGLLQQGELAGLPIASNSDGRTVFKFIKHPVFESVHRVQEALFKKASTTGFLNGQLKLNSKTGEITYGDKIICKEYSDMEYIIRGEDNSFSFGETLPNELKIKLIEEGEIKPFTLFFDELNRAEGPTMKEMMNIILNREVNGYKLPWWVNIVSAINPSGQDSEFATNEFDAAQRDRFLKVNLSPSFEEWATYSLKKGRSVDVVETLAADPSIFSVKEKRGESESDKQMSPSPRSWSMVSSIVEHLEDALNMSYFTEEDRKKYKDDLRTLVVGKVGSTAAISFLQQMSNKENRISPKDIINGKSDSINKDVSEKFKHQSAVMRVCTSMLVLQHICEEYDNFAKYKKSDDAKIASKYFNFMKQIKQFINNELNPIERTSFVRRCLKDAAYKTASGEQIHNKIAQECYAKEVFDELMAYSSELKSFEK